MKVKKTVIFMVLSMDYDEQKDKLDKCLVGQ